MNALARELQKATKSAGDNVSEALDAALEMTFPASDPVAVYIPEKVSGAQKAMRFLPKIPAK